MLTPSLELGTFFGAIFKIFEYDSRPTEDGGFFTISGFFDEIDPDGGVLVTYSVSKNLWLSVEIGYIFLAAGVRIPF